MRIYIIYQNSLKCIYATRCWNYNRVNKRNYRLYFIGISLALGYHNEYKSMQMEMSQKNSVL